MASDGSAAPEMDVVNEEMEPEVGGWKKTHRGKRGGKKRRGKSGGVRKGGTGGKGSGKGGSPVSEGAFEDTVEYYEGGERGGGGGRPGCDPKGFKPYRRKDEPDDDGGMGAADWVS